jgi:quercetin dioxygenase-like cupin family protein
MEAVKAFELFGERIEILVSTEMSDGSMVVGRQISPPGGGPAPHIHDREDEFFTVMEGEFDVLCGQSLHKLKRGESFFVPRGTLHTFKNSGTEMATMLVAVTPGGIDHYLEELSKYSMPEDLAQVQETSLRYGTQIVIY